MSTVTIIIPYKQDRGYLKEAIASVKAQTYKDIELILSQSEHGVSYNINRGIEMATGDYIRYLCDDDILQPRSIEYSVSAMGDNDFIHGDAVHFWESGRFMRQMPRVIEPTLQDMFNGNCIHGGTAMYRKSSFDKYGLFNESLWTGEEFDLNLRWLSEGAKIGYVNKDVYKYRRHAEQKSVGVHTREYQLERIQAIKDIKNKYRCKL